MANDENEMTNCGVEFEVRVDACEQTRHSSPGSPPRKSTRNRERLLRAGHLAPQKEDKNNVQ